MTTTLALVPKAADERDFLAVFSRLCVALRETQDDSGITQQVYWEALKDLSIAALNDGALTLMRERGRRFFPTTAEWRAAAHSARDAQLREAVRPARDEPWKHECRDCEDSGWVTGLSCDGTDRCGRRKPHAPHSYTMACPCRLTNRTYRRHMAFGAGAV